MRKSGNKSRAKERKVFPTYIMAIDEEKGIVDAFVSISGIMDDWEPPDIIEFGAFAKTIQERGPQGSGRIRVLWQHQFSEVIGKPILIAERSRNELPPEVLKEFPDATGGLFTRTQFVMGVQRGREAFELFKAGAMSEWSIGFDALETETDKIDDTVVRIIKEIRLWEFSPVTWGANPGTTTTGVKKDTEKRDVIAFKDTGIASKGSGWEQPKASDFSDDEFADLDAQERSRIADHYSFTEETPADDFTSLKLPHHIPLKEGVGLAVWRGVRAAMSALIGGEDIPTDERRGIYDHLVEHYSQFDEAPPDFKFVQLAQAVLDARSLEASDKLANLLEALQIELLADPPAEAVTRSSAALRLEVAERQMKLTQLT